jgi:hypothetical protein
MSFLFIVVQEAYFPTSIYEWFPGGIFRATRRLFAFFILIAGNTIN